MYGSYLTRDTTHRVKFREFEFNSGEQNRYGFILFIINKYFIFRGTSYLDNMSLHYNCRLRIHHYCIPMHGIIYVHIESHHIFFMLLYTMYVKHNFYVIKNVEFSSALEPCRWGKRQLKYVRAVSILSK